MPTIRPSLAHTGYIEVREVLPGRYRAVVRGLPAFQAEAESEEEAEDRLIEMVAESRGLGLTRHGPESSGFEWQDKETDDAVT